MTRQEKGTEKTGKDEAPTMSTAHERHHADALAAQMSLPDPTLGERAYVLRCYTCERTDAGEGDGADMAHLLALLSYAEGWRARRGKVFCPRCAQGE